jgi:hypothetical protein
MKGACVPRKAPGLVNTLPTFEYSRRLIQERLRLIESANEAGDTVQHHDPQQHVNERPPEQHPKQALQHPQRLAQRPLRQGSLRTVDHLGIVIHDRNGGGYATTHPPRLRLRSSGRLPELFCGPVNAE